MIEIENGKHKMRVTNQAYETYFKSLGYNLVKAPIKNTKIVEEKETIEDTEKKIDNKVVTDKKQSKK